MASALPARYKGLRADWTASGACTSGSPRTQGAQREFGRVVTPPRRVRQALSEVVGIVGATGGREISRRMVSEGCRRPSSAAAKSSQKSLSGWTLNGKVSRSRGLTRRFIETRKTARNMTPL
jgi:hypothetical protein